MTDFNTAGQRYDDRAWRRLQALAERAAGEVAVFDADGTLWADDVGEDFFRWLIAQGLLRDAPHGVDLWAAYEARRDRDLVGAYASVATVMAGLDEADVLAWGADFFKAHYVRRIFPAQRALFELLRGHGVEVRVVTASPRWIVQAGVPWLGLDPGAVIGIDLEIEGGLLTDRVKGPLTTGPGKVAAIDAFIGRRPALAVGNAMSDREMLEYAAGEALVINPAPMLEALATERGWIVEVWA